MIIDKTTLSDLSIFTGEEFSVFEKLNFTATSRGKEVLQKNLASPLASREAIEGVQQTVKLFLQNIDRHKSRITNGTLMVVENFYGSNIDTIPLNASPLAAFNYKLFHGPDYSLVKYSVTHGFDFIKGMKELVEITGSENLPAPLKKVTETIKELLSKNDLDIIYRHAAVAEMKPFEILRVGHFLRYKFKRQMLELVMLFAQLDAWNSMALAVKNLNLTFPEFVESDHPVIVAEDLYHILLKKPVAYNIELNKENKFLFLTGANMAGKSTFIKSVGTAVFLAHTGLGVPAKKMSLTCFDGLLSNINVMDNLVKGESYFYNEVQRIKTTLTRINDGRKWLILIDELFKGTNVQDAMKCSKVVIEGLLKIDHSLFILSTHLYEIGHELQHHPNIRFSYFETTMKDDILHFNYKLKPGISNDRLGYLILKQEGVVDLIEKLK